ncbi:MAG: TonB-dependent receptor plug domain-containing protein [Bacteroidales bacterium]|nr:TonB-dependent receptor plug domain-containing protein [Bacteroidales bacterium]
MYGQTEGTVKAKLIEKTSINVKNVVSYEEIEGYPDANAAEVLQRVPGITLQRDQGEGRYVQLRGTAPELTNFSVNGEQIPSPEGSHRYVGLDIISADQIEYIEVSKVLTPDMDADGIGGNINIITKKATKDEPVTNISIAGGYNQLANTFDNFQGNFSQSLRHKKLGTSINASYYRNNSVSQNMEFTYHKLPYQDSAYQARGNNYHIAYDEFQLRHYTVSRQRIGLSGTLDYKLFEKTTVYANGMFNSFNDRETRRRVLYEMEDPGNFNYYNYGGIERDVKARTKHQSLTTMNLGAEHDMSFLKIDAEVSYAIAREKQPDRIELGFENHGQTIPLIVNDDDKDYPRIKFPSDSALKNATDFETYEFNGLQLSNINTLDENKTYKVNFTIPLGTDKNIGNIKFGAKYREKHKTQDDKSQVYSDYYYDDTWARRRWYTAADFDGPAINATSFSNGFSENNLMGKHYVVDYVPDPSLFLDFYENHAHQFYLTYEDTKYQTYGDDYKAWEKIFAYYAMVNLNVGKFNIIGGARFTLTNAKYQGYDFSFRRKCKI